MQTCFSIFVVLLVKRFLKCSKIKSVKIEKRLDKYIKINLLKLYTPSMSDFINVKVIGVHTELQLVAVNVKQ